MWRALLCCATLFYSSALAARSFIIANDSFVQDGQPTRLVNACIHYSRVRPEQWADRLARLRAMGVNGIQTYVPWNFHNPRPGLYRWDGEADLVQFLKLAQEAGLLVVLRAGPYMCGEWEFGGLPAWLLDGSPARTPMVVRTYSANYIAEVNTWWSTLLPLIKPMLYENGGPVVMVQCENEFGSYGDVQTNPLDYQYMTHLVALARQFLGPNVILFTTDGGDVGYMSRGTLNGSAVFTVGDFGPGSDPAVSFSAQKQFNPPGLSPNMCSEYYTGWLTHWGETMANTSSAGVVTSLKAILDLGGSVSFYMGLGGSNFGFWSGANGGGGTDFQPHITSYDYDSPVSEGGGHGYGADETDKYSAIQRALAMYLPPPPPEPPAPRVVVPPPVTLVLACGFLPAVHVLASALYESQPQPLPQEVYNQSQGFTLYQTLLPSNVPATFNLDIHEVRDRAQVFAGSLYQGSVYRTAPASINVTGAKAGQVLSILVENMGRINYGHGMTDPKGIVGAGVLINGALLVGLWDVLTVPLDNYTMLNRIPFSAALPAQLGPAFFRGSFTVSGAPADTYVLSTGWTKGVIWVNGFNLGRYWETKGPQHTLYVPASVVQTGVNDLIILELEAAPAGGAPTVLFSGVPVFAPPPPPPACSPLPTAVVGANVAVYQVGAAFSVNQQWKFSGSSGAISLASQPTLCLAPGPHADPESGQPDMILAACNSADSKQQFVNISATLQLKNTGTGSCLDITSHAQNNGAHLELYACDGTPALANQVWTLTSAGLLLSAQQPLFAITVCQ